MLRRKSNEVREGMLKLVNDTLLQKIKEGLLRPLSRLMPRLEVMAQDAATSLEQHHLFHLFEIGVAGNCMQPVDVNATGNGTTQVVLSVPLDFK